MSVYAQKRLTTLCISCDSKIQFAMQPQLGQIVICPECEDRLTIVDLSPLELDWADYQDEGWQDDDGDDWDNWDEEDDDDDHDWDED